MVDHETKGTASVGVVRSARDPVNSSIDIDIGDISFSLKGRIDPPAVAGLSASCR
jgi:hypothetical protein